MTPICINTDGSIHHRDRHRRRRSLHHHPQAHRSRSTAAFQSGRSVAVAESTLAGDGTDSFFSGCDRRCAGAPAMQRNSDRDHGRSPWRRGGCGRRTGVATIGGPHFRGAGGQRGKLSRHPDLIDCLYLIRNGVPFDVAFSLPTDERMAFVVALGTLDGRVFDWRTLHWKPRT